MTTILKTERTKYQYFDSGNDKGLSKINNFEFVDH